MKNICVFLSAKDLDKKYTEPAQRFGELLAQNNLTFVYGGSEKGLMKVVATAVQQAGGRIVGVTMEMMKEWRKLDADEMIIAKDLSERKAMLNERSDAFVVMPGGLGTLDEVSELLEIKQLGLHAKPIIFLNTDNYFDGLKNQFIRMDAEGFLTVPLNDLVLFTDSPEEVISRLKQG